MTASGWGGAGGTPGLATAGDEATAFWGEKLFWGGVPPKKCGFSTFFPAYFGLKAVTRSNARAKPRGAVLRRGVGGGWLDWSTQNPPTQIFWGGNARIFAKGRVDPAVGAPPSPGAAFWHDARVLAKGRTGPPPVPDALFGVVERVLQRVALTWVQECSNPHVVLG